MHYRYGDKMNGGMEKIEIRENWNGRKEIKINKLVGRIGNEYYICDDIFSYEDGLQGGGAGCQRQYIGKRK